MTGCCWCGSPCGVRAACLKCAPNQDQYRTPEDLDTDPDEAMVAELEQCRARLAEEGIPQIVFPPDEPEWCDLNEERYLHALHEHK